jgi:hypothetical protein
MQIIVFFISHTLLQLLKNHDRNQGKHFDCPLLKRERLLTTGGLKAEEDCQIIEICDVIALPNHSGSLRESVL